VHNGNLYAWMQSYYTFGDRDSAKPRTLMFDDMRVCELLECYQDPITLHKRPWIEAKRMPGIAEFKDNTYPVEWRVFIKGGQIEGISYYYPQSEYIIEDDCDDCWIEEVLTDYTSDIMEVLGKFNLLPHHPQLAGAPANVFPCFTLDFLQTPDNEFLFLEAGPPHVNGLTMAHSCCFVPGNIKGMALHKQYADIYDPGGTRRI
jgi:hypothetical protein